MLNQELIDSVISWADEKGILEYGTSEGQLKKTVEELGEALDALKEMKDKQAIDCFEEYFNVINELGDIFVTLIIGLKLVDYDFSKFKRIKSDLSFAGSIICENYLFAGHVISKFAEYSNEIKAKNLTFILSDITIACERLKVDPDFALEVAYNKIKKRKGKMVDGVFVKDA